MGIISKLVGVLGLFEFFSAYQWATKLTAEQKNTNNLVPAAVLADSAHFQAPFVWALVMLGAVRVCYATTPRHMAMWAMTLLTHVAEVGFWMHFAQLEPFAGGKPLLTTLLEAMAQKRGAFPPLVLGGPIILCVLLLLDIPRGAQKAARTKVN